jgi:hypothetical protein
MSDAIERRLITEADAARYMGVSRSYLANSRCSGNEGAPAFVQHGRMIRYDLRDLEAWIEERKHKPTGAVSPPCPRVQLS